MCFQTKTLFTGYLFLQFILCALSTNIHAEELSKEYKLKAAYLFNFTRFTEWPDDSFESNSSPIQLCIQSNSHFINFLTALVDNRQIGKDNRTIEVIGIRDESATSSCHVIYLNCSNCRPVMNKNALIIGDDSSKNNHYSSINFFQKNNKVKFEVILPNLIKSNIKLSSELLKLARKVES